MHSLDLLTVLAHTPAFNSTAQIYQIILSFLSLVVLLFVLFGVYYIATTQSAVTRSEAKARVAEAKARAQWAGVKAERAEANRELDTGELNIIDDDDTGRGQ